MDTRSKYWTAVIFVQTISYDWCAMHAEPCDDATTLCHSISLIFNSNFLAASICIQHQTTVIKTKAGPTYDMIDEQLS